MFFDNCTSPIYANILHALISPSGSAAFHVRHMPEFGFTAATLDIDWIARLGEDRQSDWVVVTGDDRIRRNKTERLAWKRAGLKGFVLAQAFQRTPRHQCASHLVWRWPEMERFIASAAPGSLFELPISRNGGFVPLSV